MANKLVFRLKEENDIKYEDGKFSVEKNGIWLTLYTDSLTCDLCKVADDVSELNYDNIMEILKPTNLNSLLYTNLSEYEIEEIESVLMFSEGYYLSISDDMIYIKKLNEEETKEYIKSFEEKLKTAISKYGDENVDIILDTDTSLYNIMYHSKNNSFAYCEGFASDYITSKVAQELSDKYCCGYCD